MQSQLWRYVWNSVLPGEIYLIIILCHVRKLNHFSFVMVKYPCEIFHKISCGLFCCINCSEILLLNESNTLAWIITHDAQDYTCGI